MRFCVSVVSYNGSRYLRRCLESVLASQHPDFHVVCVDNGSSDDTLAIMRSFEGARVQVVAAGENLGYGQGHVRAFQHCRGDVLLCLNDDTHVDPAWLTAIEDVLEEDPRIGICGCRILDGYTGQVDHVGASLLPNALSIHWRDAPTPMPAWIETEYVTGAAIAIRAPVFRYLGGFCEDYWPLYYEEAELCLRARRAGLRVVCALGAVVHHLGQETSGGLTAKYYNRYHRCRWRFILRNYSKRELLRCLGAELVWWLSLRNPEQLVPTWRGLAAAIPYLPRARQGRKTAWPAPYVPPGDLPSVRS